MLMKIEVSHREITVIALYAMSVFEILFSSRAGTTQSVNRVISNFLLEQAVHSAKYQSKVSLKLSRRSDYFFIIAS